MGRSITVTIDSDDLVEMLCDRVAYWSDKIPYGAEELFYQYYEDMVDAGAYDGMKDFSVAMIVDNDIINDIDVVDEKELAERGIDPDDALMSDGKLYLIDARM